MPEAGPGAGAPRLPKPARVFLDQDEDAVVLGAGTPPGLHPRVLVTAADTAALRVEVGPAGVESGVVGLLLDRAAAAPTFEPRTGWPALTGLRSRRLQRHWWCVLRFAEPVDVADLVTELGRQAVWRDRGELPIVVGPAAGRAAGPARLDARVLNPIGFLVDAPEPVRDLADLAALGPTGHGVGAGLVADLRTAAGVRVSDWSAPGVGTAVAGLAIAGVPVVAADPDAVPAGLLEPAVAAAVTAPVDLADPVAREEHSLVLRRAALDAHALGWGRATQPSVSVVLATRRADMLDHALAQVDRQRGVERLELVLAPHGFDVDAGMVAARLGDRVSVQVLPQPDATAFGDVLHAAYLASGGDVVLKMDDDDWYAPDVVTDLLRARAYSGAELVGMPPGRHYLVEHDRTVQRRTTTEAYARFVAGGTMLVDRPVLREAGGFRSVRRYVDAQLLGAVLGAGGAVYRTHGLGYVLRRNASGHTWQVGSDELLDPTRLVASWPGFVPSRLMELPGSAGAS